jgi:hypothetical protein
MSQTLTRQRCLHHPVREAVARCPSCGQFYCRECVVEHDDRVICADCLQRIARPDAKKRRSAAWLSQLVLGGLGLLTAWFFFYEAGQVLLLIPTSFHDGTLWEKESP